MTERSKCCTVGEGDMVGLLLGEEVDVQRCFGGTRKSEWERFAEISGDVAALVKGSRRRQYYA